MWSIASSGTLPHTLTPTLILTLTLTLALTTTTTLVLFRTLALAPTPEPYNQARCGARLLCGGQPVGRQYVPWALQYRSQVSRCGHEAAP